MINAYNLSDAVPVTLFGIFALWAACSKRHWFIRVAVVAAAILVTLFIPAFELVLLLSVETLTVVTGIALWRRKRRRATSNNDPPSLRLRLSVSLETLMLAVVVVAVVTAVVARAPAMPGINWYSFILDGMIGGTIALACAWLVGGRAPWYERLAGAVLLAPTFAFAYYSLHWAGYLANYWLTVPNGNLRSYFEYAKNDLPVSMKYWTPTIGLGVAVLCIWLVCLRAAGWFDPLDDASTKTTAPSDIYARQRVARIISALLFAGIAAFPLALLYQLLTPTPIPRPDLPNPNGFDDLVAAGKLIDDATMRKLNAWDQFTIVQLRDELAKHERVLQLTDQALSRPSRNPYAFVEEPQDSAMAIIRLASYYHAKSALDRRAGNVDEIIANQIRNLRIAQDEYRGTGTGYLGGIFTLYEKDYYVTIWKAAAKLDAQKISDLIHKLGKLETRREPWAERIRISRIQKEHAGWQNHLMLILSDWSGEELSRRDHTDDLRRIAQLRMLKAKLVIRAYQLDNNRLPAQLDDLVPQYLPELPNDPFGTGKLQYRPQGDSYLLYSLGPDRVDDNGKPLSPGTEPEVGDLTDKILFDQIPFQYSIGGP